MSIPISSQRIPLRSDSAGPFQLFYKAEMGHNSCCIWWYLNPCADGQELFRSFENGYIERVFTSTTRNGTGQPSQSCSNDDNTYSLCIQLEMLASMSGLI